MTKVLKKSLVLTAAIAAPLFISAPAFANTGTPLVDQQAVAQFTSSVKKAVQAYDLLAHGDVAKARSSLEQAVRGLEQAVTKDPTLGFTQKNANALHQKLKAVKLKMLSDDSTQARSELGNVLSSSGIIVLS